MRDQHLRKEERGSRTEQRGKWSCRGVAASVDPTGRRSELPWIGLKQSRLSTSASISHWIKGSTGAAEANWASSQMEAMCWLRSQPLKGESGQCIPTSATGFSSTHTQYLFISSNPPMTLFQKYIKHFIFMANNKMVEYLIQIYPKLNSWSTRPIVFAPQSSLW